MSWVHPFEKSGLGTAPFACIGVTEKWYSAAPGQTVLQRPKMVDEK